MRRGCRNCNLFLFWRARALRGAVGLAIALSIVMAERIRQDLCARALRFSIAVGAFHRVASPREPTIAHAAMQLYRSATGIGASLEEGQVSKTRGDMAAKYAIALREAREALYWLKLLREEPALTRDASELAQEAGEFVAMLTVSVRKLRNAR